MLAARRPKFNACNYSGIESVRLILGFELATQQSPEHAPPHAPCHTGSLPVFLKLSERCFAASIDVGLGEVVSGP
jgi:hypothetical protein